MATSDKRDTAERAFVSATKAPQRPERARSEQEEETQAIGDKTARLKSLRLARDAAEKQAARDKAAVETKRSKSGKMPRKGSGKIDE